MYPFGRFRDDAKQALTLAHKEAERAANGYIGTEHILIALTRAAGPAKDTLSGLGVDTDGARASVAAVTRSKREIGPRRVVPTSRVKTAVELAFGAARTLSSDAVGGDHLLLGILLEGDGIASHLLEEAGAGLEIVCDRLGVDVRALRAIERPRSSISATGELPVQGVEWQVSSAPQVGVRVLVHDNEPPYRIWEGVVTERGGSEVTVFVDGHPDGQRIVSLDRLHSLPPRVIRCRFCEHPAAAQPLLDEPAGPT